MYLPLFQGDIFEHHIFSREPKPQVGRQDRLFRFSPLCPDNPEPVFDDRPFSRIQNGITGCMLGLYRDNGQ